MTAPAPAPASVPTAASAPGRERRTDAPTGPSRPLYKIPAMWFVIGGPAVAVVASITSAVLAYHGADRPLLEGAAVSPHHPLSPAMQARNHAATPHP